jgi:hypothetical protein
LFPKNLETAADGALSSVRMKLAGRVHWHWLLSLFPNATAYAVILPRLLAGMESAP